MKWIAVLVLLMMAPLRAEQWYVSQTSGNDGNVGNISTAPKQTCNAVEPLVGSNDTVNVTGTFNESTNGGDHLYGDYYRANLFFQNLTNVVVRTWPDSARARFYGNKPASCSWPPSCGAVTGFDGTGLDFLHCNGFQVLDIDFRYCARCIFMDNDTNWLVRGCTFDSIFAPASHVGGNGNCGDLCNFGGVFVGYNGTGNNSTNAGRITNCTFGASIYSMCGSTGPWTLTTGGQNGGSIFSYEMGWTRVDSCTFSSAYTQIYMKGECHYNTFEYNHHTGAQGHGGVYVSSDKRDSIRFNVFEQCAIGVQVNSYINSSTYLDTPMVYNNTFYGCGTCIEATCEDKPGRDIVAFNNISMKFSSRALGYDGWGGVNNITNSTIQYWDYNAYDNTTPSTKFTFNDLNYTFATWNGQGRDTHGLNAAPDFFLDTTFAGGRDFHLNPSSASYAVLSGGGRGGAYSTSFGAFPVGGSSPPFTFPPLPLRKRGDLMDVPGRFYLAVSCCGAIE